MECPSFWHVAHGSLPTMRRVKSKAVSTNSMPAPWQSPDTPPTARRSHQNQPQISRGAARSAGTNQQVPNRMNSQIAKSTRRTDDAKRAPSPAWRGGSQRDQARGAMRAAKGMTISAGSETRSEERRVGKKWVRKCNARGG